MTEAVPAGEPRPLGTSRRTVGDILVQIVGRLANSVLGVVVAVLITRTLGADSFGQWSTLLAVVSLAGLLAELAIAQVAITRAVAHPREEPSWFGALLIVRFALAIVAAAACIIVVQLLAVDAQMRIAGALLAGTILLAGPGALAAIFQVRMRNDLTIAVLTVNSVLWTAAVACVAATGGGIVPLAASFLGAAVITLVLQTVVALRRMAVSFEEWRARGRELVRIGLPLSVATVLVLAYGRIDQLLVFAIAGDEPAGLYGAAYRILDQMQIVPLSICSTLYPIIVRAHASDPDRLRFILQRALEVSVAAALGAIAFAIPSGGDALALLFGESFRAAGPALAILMGAFLVISLGYLNGTLVIVLGLQKRRMVCAAIGLVVNLALNVALIPRFGYVAAAWVTLGTELVVVALMSRPTLAAMAWRPDVSVILRAVLAAALTCLTLTGLRAADIPVGALLAITPVLYGGLLVALRGLRVAETVALVRGGSRV